MAEARASSVPDHSGKTASGRHGTPGPGFAATPVRKRQNQGAALGVARSIAPTFGNRSAENNRIRLPRSSAVDHERDRPGKAGVRDLTPTAHVVQALRLQGREEHAPQARPIQSGEHSVVLTYRGGARCHGHMCARIAARSDERRELVVSWFLQDLRPLARPPRLDRLIAISVEVRHGQKSCGRWRVVRGSVTKR